MKSYQNIQVQKRRITILFFFLMFVSVVVVIRLFQLQVLDYRVYADRAKEQHWSENEIQPKRGNIYVRDMNGDLYPLATSIRLDKVFVDLESCEDKTKTAEKLEQIIRVKKNKILKTFDESTSKRYIPVKRKISVSESEKIKSMGDSCVGLEPEYWRVYPEKEMASQVLGYVDEQGNGVGGIEQYFQEDLAGVPGMYKAEADSMGNKILTGRDISVQAQDGHDVVLTLNRDIQAQVEASLKKTVQSFSAARGSVIVLDPRTGDILAMANYPTFDPNKYSVVKDYSRFKNPALSDVFEPGSIFKVITMAAGLNEGKIEPDSKFNDTGSITLNGYTIRNSDLKAHGEVTITNVLEKSLNTGTTHVQQLLGKDTFYKYLKSFGFDKLTGVEAPSGAEGVGVINKPSEVNDHTYATMSFGQSISATPLRMIMGFSAVANEGNMSNPHFLVEVLKGGKKIKEYKQLDSRRMISQEAAAKLTKMMVSVVIRGHGTQAGVPGYKVAGKTGTAQVPKVGGGGYEMGKNIGSFIGFAPADSPRFVVMAKIDEPQGVAWAESTAAPLVGEILQKLLNYYQVPPTEGRQ